MCLVQKHVANYPFPSEPTSKETATPHLALGAVFEIRLKVFGHVDRVWMGGSWIVERRGLASRGWVVVS